MTKYTLYVANSVHALEQALASRYGGVTTVRGHGIWLDPSGRHDEPTNILTVFVDGGKHRVPPHHFDELVAQLTTERAYVLEGPDDTEIRFVEELRSTWRKHGTDDK